MTCIPEDKTQLNVLVDKHVKNRAQHILLDRGISLAKWINQVLTEFVAKHGQASRVRIVGNDMQDGK
jgi:hypothetical protein